MDVDEVEVDVELEDVFITDYKNSFNIHFQYLVVSVVVVVELVDDVVPVVVVLVVVDDVVIVVVVVELVDDVEVVVEVVE